MKKTIFLSSAVILTAIMMPGCVSSPDAISKESFAEVEIGEQIWMDENLNVDRFRNADSIHQAKTAEEWEMAIKSEEPAWCYYDNDSANGIKYGKLYNWFAVIDPRGLAPEGWHIPSHEDWAQLTSFLGGGDLAGIKMRSITGWENEGNSTNESGFNALPGGFRGLDGIFSSIGNSGYWWSSTVNITIVAWSDFLGYKVRNIDSKFDGKIFGNSVRCVRNKIE